MHQLFVGICFGFRERSGFLPQNPDFNPFHSEIIGTPIMALYMLTTSSVFILYRSSAKRKSKAWPSFTPAAVQCM